MTNTKIQFFLRSLSLICLGFFFAFPQAQGTHIVGGQLTYRCLGGNSYELKLVVRRDCENAHEEATFDNPAAIFVYDGDFDPITNIGSGGSGGGVLLMDLNQSDTISETFPGACFGQSGDLCVQTATYVDTFLLPRRPGGYNLMYQRCCRNNLLDNIEDPLNTGASYIVTISEQALETCNSGPQMGDYPSIYTCLGEPFEFDHSVTDKEGDSIVYKLFTPFEGATAEDPIPDVTGIHPDRPGKIEWIEPTYSENQMFGNPDDPLTIDPETGVLSGMPIITGTFLVSVCVEEYRNGVLLSRSFRDFQVSPRDCSESPITDFEPSGVFCEGLEIEFENLSENASHYQWFFDLNDTALSSTEENPTFTYPDTGDYQVMLISTEDSVCFDTLVQDLKLRESALDVDFDIAVQGDCSDSILLQLSDRSSDTLGGIGTRTWTIEYGDTSLTRSGDNPVLVIREEGTVRITLMVNPENGCPPDSLTKEYEAKLIDLELVGDSLSICNGESTELLLNPDPDLEYEWLPDLQLEPNNMVGDPTATPDSSVTYYVTATDGFCLAQDSIFVEVRQGNIEIVELSTDSCSQERILTADGIEYDSLHWSDVSDFSNVLSKSDTFSLDILENSTIYLEAFNDSLNCPLVDSINLIYNGLKLDYQDTVELCIRDTATYTMMSLDPDEEFTIQWNPHPIIIDGEDSSTITLYTDTLQDETLVFTATNEHGCTITDSIYFSVIDSKEADFTYESECTSLTVEFFNSDSTGTWEWDFGDGNTSTENSPVHTYEEMGSYDVTLTFTGACTSNKTETIEVSRFALDHQDTIELCIRDTTSYTVNSLDPDADFTINWNPSPIIIDGEDSTTITLYTDTLQDEILVFTAIDDEGCEINDSIYVSVIDRKDADFSYESDCGSLTVEFFNSDSSGMWEWDFGDGNTSTEINPVHTYEENGRYQVTLTFTGTCTNSQTQTISVSEIDLDDFRDTLLICPGQTVELNPDGNPNYEYEWSPAGPLDDPNSHNPSATVENTTVFTATIRNAPDTCSIEAMVVVEAIDPFDIEVEPSTICPGDTVNLRAIPSNPDLNISWEWSPESEILSDPTASSIIATPNQTTVFSVTGTTEDGCEVTKSATVNVEQLDSSVVAVAMPPDIEFGDDSQLDVINGSNGWSYSWSPGGDLSDSTIRDPIANPRDTTTYTVTITTENGCEFQRDVTVNVDQPNCEPPWVFLPNAFSPNGDGVNDELFVRGEFVEDVELIIYNRWGEKVFETRDQSVGWDGTYNGKENEPGSFGYYLHVTCENGGEHMEQGSIQLLR